MRPGRRVSGGQRVPRIEARGTRHAPGYLYLGPESSRMCRASLGPASAGGPRRVVRSRPCRIHFSLSVVVVGVLCKPGPGPPCSRPRPAMFQSEFLLTYTAPAAATASTAPSADRGSALTAYFSLCHSNPHCSLLRFFVISHVIEPSRHPPLAPAREAGRRRGPSGSQSAAAICQRPRTARKRDFPYMSQAKEPLNWPKTAV